MKRWLADRRTNGIDSRGHHALGADARLSVSLDELLVDIVIVERKLLGDHDAPMAVPVAHDMSFDLHTAIDRERSER